jgi:hypothetical protein
VCVWWSGGKMGGFFGSMMGVGSMGRLRGLGRISLSHVFVAAS